MLTLQQHKKGSKMKLKTFVEFNLYDGADSYYQKPLEKCMNLEKLREYVSKIGENETVFLNLCRRVYILNNDLVLNQMKDGLDGGNFRFFVQDKLMYPSDVNSVLAKEYKSGHFGLYFEDCDKINGETPLVLFKKKFVSGDCGNRLREYNLCRPLNANDVVVDKNLNQIWPKKTHKLQSPVALIKFLKQTTENVYSA